MENLQFGGGFSVPHRFKNEHSIFLIHLYHNAHILSLD